MITFRQDNFINVFLSLDIFMAKFGNDGSADCFGPGFRFIFFGKVINYLVGYWDILGPTVSKLCNASQIVVVNYEAGQFLISWTI